MSDKTFEWNDALVVEFITWSLNSSPLYQGRYKDLEDFKKSKEKDIPKDKDWKILSFMFEGKPMPYVGTYSQKNLIKNGYLIHSVKRLDNSEVFTIDDITSEGRICGIEFYNNEVIFSFEGGSRKSHSNNVKKVKPKIPLYTTEKNEPIYYMDEYWIVTDLGFNKYWFRAKNELSGKNPFNKYFLTEKEADEYILLNKPIEVSFSDLHKLIRSHEHGTSINAIHDYFKSKLKL